MSLLRGLVPPIPASWLGHRTGKHATQVGKRGHGFRPAGSKLLRKAGNHKLGTMHGHAVYGSRA